MDHRAKINQQQLTMIERRIRALQCRRPHRLDGLRERAETVLDSLDVTEERLAAACAISEAQLLDLLCSRYDAVTAETIRRLDGGLCSYEQRPPAALVGEYFAPADIAEVLRTFLRNNPQVSMKELATRAGVSRRALNKILVGETRHVTFDLADRICLATGVGPASRAFRFTLRKTRVRPPQATPQRRLQRRKVA